MDGSHLTSVALAEDEGHPQQCNAPHSDVDKRERIVPHHFQCDKHHALHHCDEHHHTPVPWHAIRTHESDCARCKPKLMSVITTPLWSWQSVSTTARTGEHRVSMSHTSSDPAVGMAGLDRKISIVSLRPIYSATGLSKWFSDGCSISSTICSTWSRSCSVTSARVCPTRPAIST